MRIVTWNCFRGDCLERAAELKSLAPDVSVLQECAQPGSSDASRSVAWFGDSPRQGVGVVASAPFIVSPGAANPAFKHTAFPAIVRGPTSFHLLAVWAQPNPSYVRSLLDALDIYADFLRSAPSVMIGDFNCFTHWDGKPPSKAHVELARRLRDEFKLVSAYHAAPNYDPKAPDAPTHFYRWKEGRPFHIDYCYVPAAWRNAIRSVRVGGFEEQHWRSDHRPVLVDLDLTSSGAAP